MFAIHLSNNVGIGDTVDCRINAEPARVTWRDAQTLVIEPGDARRILRIAAEGDLNLFICTDADGADDFTIITDRPEIWRKP
jgi:hypothetical protein